MTSLRERLDPDWLLEHASEPCALLDRTHRVATALFVLTFAGYALAVAVWFFGNSWFALLIATLSFLFFRQFRGLSLGLARLPMRGDPTMLPLLRAIDEGLETASARQVVRELEELCGDGHNEAKSGES